MTTILQPPTLDHDVMMLERYKVKVHTIGKIERRVVWNLLSQLSDAGFGDFRVDDGEEETACKDAKAVMELVFNLDDAYVFCKHATKGRQHWIRLVFGNDGYDAVSDYGDPQPDFDGFGKLMNSFDGEDYV